MKEEKKPAPFVVKLLIVVAFGLGFIIQTPAIAYLYGIVFMFVALMELGTSMDEDN